MTLKATITLSCAMIQSEWYKKNPELGLKVCNEGAATVIVVLLPVMEKVAAKMK